MSDNQRLIEAVRRERTEALAREPQLERERHQFALGQPEDGLAVARCSCGVWKFGPFPPEHLADAQSQHERHVDRATGTKFEIGYGVRCKTFRVTNPEGRVSTGFVCGRNTSRKRCQVCKTGWSDAQCDYPTGGACKKCKGTGVRDGFNCHDCAGTARAMCNMHLCSACRTQVAPDEDYCPTHRALAGVPSPKPPLDGVWLYSVRTATLCWRCQDEIAVGHTRAMWFPEKQKLMCAACGELGVEKKAIKLS